MNKPAGIVVNTQKNEVHGSMTVRTALPYVLSPPKNGTIGIIRRPVSVHRLDKPTSGLVSYSQKITDNIYSIYS